MCSLRTTQTFILKATKIHGGKYNYSKVDYKHNKEKVEIICPIHGSFFQTPNKHIQNHGCHNCANNKPLTTEQFVKKAEFIHGKRYDYYNVEYINNSTKVEIICPIHGSFFQVAGSHLNKRGCPRCGKTKNYTKQNFIEEAQKIHKNKYSYVEVKYKNNSTKVKITCFIHGIFLQTPSNHLYGYGCPACAGVKPLTTKIFIQRAELLHGKNYDYTFVKYISNKHKVEIVCLKCKRSFKQIPSSHLSGKGCLYCVHRISKPETKWLDEQNIAMNFRQFRIKLPEQKKHYEVDGYDPDTNTIYEFLGDYWHGNPKKYKPDDFNKRNKKTFGELYLDTMNKINLFQNNGYNVKYIWEQDYKQAEAERNKSSLPQNKSQVTN